jgi:tetratricopeptide (TPR) repeat protein
MENTFFLRIEIILFLISFWYVCHFIGIKIINFSFKKQRWLKGKNWNITNKKGEDIKEVVNNIIIKETEFKTDEDLDVNIKNKVKITEILRKESVFYEKWDYEKAKNLIIEGLTLDKNNRLLNLELANIYNKQSEYKKSEYIYRELIEKQKEDFDLLKKLWFVLALQKKYKDSIRVYKEALEKKENDNWIVDILSDLTFEVEDFEWCIRFAKKTLKDKPKDWEKLQLVAYSYDHLWDFENALVYYWKIIEIQPYNTKIIDRINEIKNVKNTTP